MPRVIGPVVIEISGNTIKFTKAVGQASARMQVFQRRMKAAGATMTRYLTLPLLAAAGASVKFAVDFNKAMANVATMIPGNTVRVLELKKAVQELAIETGKSTGDLATGLYRVVSAFGDTSESMGRLELAAKTATAGVTDTDSALGLLSIMTKAYGNTTLPAMIKAADIAFMTVKKGDTNFRDLAASMGQAMPWGAKLGIAMEEVAASFSTLAGATGSTSEAATQIAGAFRGLAQGTPGLKKALKELGDVTIEDLIATEGWLGALKKLVATTDGTAGAIKAMVGRAEGALAVMSLAGTATQKYTEDLQDMTKATGAMTEAYKAQTEGINEAGHQLNQLRSASQVAGQQIGDILLPALLKVTIKAKELADGFNSLDDSTKKLIVTLGILVAAAGPLAKLIVLFTRLGVFAGPAGALVAGVAALGLGIKTLCDKIAPLPEKVKLSTETLALLSEQMVEMETVTAALIERLEETAEAIDEVKTAADEASPALIALRAGMAAAGEEGWSWAEMFAKEAAALRGQPLVLGPRLEREAKTVRSMAEILEAELRGYWETFERSLAARAPTKLQKPGKEGKPHVFAEAKGWFGELAESIQLTQGHLVAFADSWADTVSRAIVEGELLSLKLSDFFKQITQELLKMAIAMKVVRPLFNAIFPEGGADTGVVSPSWRPSGTEPPIPPPTQMGMVPMTFNFHDHHSAPGEMEVQEKRGPGGARVFEIMVRDAWKKSFAANAFDSDLARMGAQRQGVGR